MNLRNAASCGELRKVGLAMTRSKAACTSLLLGGPSLLRPKFTVITPLPQPTLAGPTAETH
jgi:hypothetical protein